MQFALMTDDQTGSNSSLIKFVAQSDARQIEIHSNHLAMLQNSNTTGDSGFNSYQITPVKMAASLEPSSSKTVMLHQNPVEISVVAKKNM